MAQASGDDGAPAAAAELLCSLPDAHAHPQLDLDNAPCTMGLRVPCVAAMSVAANVDWAKVEQLAELAGPEKLIPGFGIHPWWSHLHASSLGSTWEELLEAPSPEELARALEVLTKERAAQQGVETGAGVRYEAARGGRDGEFGAGALGAAREEESPGGRGGGDPCHSTTGDGGDNGAITSGKNTASGSGSVVGADGAASSPGPCGGGPLDIVSHAAWRQRLQSLLDAHPGAIVGEVGVDRAAVIPGTRARVRFDHQLALLAEQLALAAELGRPASVHCVRGYGHLLSLFAGLPGPGACPPAVMLHSYGGSPEEVGRFTRLKGIGGRFYFSFSAAINARTPEKLAARIRAVPDDRLLLESDQVTPLLIDSGMAQICEITAAAKSWTVEEAAARTLENFNRFYSRSRGA